MCNFVNTRKNFPDAQKLSGWQCHRATGVFGTLGPCKKLVIMTIVAQNNRTSSFYQRYNNIGFIRLGRLRSGGAKGPGIFFVIPCIDKYHKVGLQ